MMARYLMDCPCPKDPIERGDFARAYVVNSMIFFKKNMFAKIIIKMFKVDSIILKM